jgi:hypothetical protein
MVYPGQFETLFWVAALPTSLACLFMLAVFALTIAFARRRVGWWVVALMPALVFALCCLNEQPAAGVAAMPFLYWAALPRRALFAPKGYAMVAAGEASPRGRAEPVDDSLELQSAEGALESIDPARAVPPDRASLRSHLLRALIPTLLCTLAALTYTALVLFDPNKIPNSRGSVDAMISLGELGPRLLSFLDVLWRRLVLKNFAQGALLTGLAQLRSPAGAAWLFALLLSSALWLRAWTTRPVERRPPPLRLIPLGLVIFLAGWLPILIFARYEPDSRTRYWPCLGWCLALGGVFSWLGPRIAARRAPLRFAAGLLLVAVLFVNATMLVGVQAAFRARFAQDRAQAGQVRRAIPNPAPLTFFLPLRVERHAVHTRSPVFDAHFRSPWEFPWTAPKFITGVYKRSDVRCGYYRYFTPGLPVIGADESGVHYADRLGPKFPPIEGSGSRIPWARVVPFVVEADGSVRFVTRVLFPSTDPAAPPIEVRIRQAPAGAPDFPFSLPRA